MTAAVMERRAFESFDEKAHVHIDKFAAVDERATAFTLFPDHMRDLEKRGLVSKADRGGLAVAPGLVEVNINAFDWLAHGESMLALMGPLAVPRITKDLMLAVGADVIGTVDWEGNLLANAGINRMGGLTFGAGTGQIYNTANSAIGAGDTNTAAAATQTDLSAAVNSLNRYIQVVDSQPAFATQVATLVATFGTGNGNFAWAEWVISQNTTSGANAATAALFNRKVASLGTKTSSAAWAFTVTITLS